MLQIYINAIYLQLFDVPLTQNIILIHLLNKVFTCNGKRLAVCQINEFGSTQGTFIQNLKQIRAAVPEKKSKIGYYIVTYSNIL